MPDGGTGRFRDNEEHPSRLPWFVAGTLDPAEAAQVEAHLVACAACRAEADALASMRRTVLDLGGGSHAAAETLNAYSTGDSALPAQARRTIEAHLERCAECAEDLAALERSRRALSAAEEPAPAGASGPRRWTFPRRAVRPVAGAAAAALLAVLGFIWTTRGGGPGDQGTPSLGAVDATLLPGVRGEPPSAALHGEGPWVVRIVLPFGADHSEYLVRVAGAGGGAARKVAGGLRPADDGSLTVTIPELPGAGTYQVFVEPPGAPAPRAYRYRFQLVEP